MEVKMDVYLDVKEIVDVETRHFGFVFEAKTLQILQI
jgi:hypothetical protein